jgi:hypothetical protein
MVGFARPPDQAERTVHLKTGDNGMALNAAQGQSPPKILAQAGILDIQEPGLDFFSEFRPANAESLLHGNLPDGRFCGHKRMAWKKSPMRRPSIFQTMIRLAARTQSRMSNMHRSATAG